MRFGRTFREATLALCTAGFIAFLGFELVSTRVHVNDNSNSEESQITIGWRSAPPFLNTQGKNPALVGLGSFIVNAQSDCNGCHSSDPANEYLPTNNPYFLSPPNSGPRKYN